MTETPGFVDNNGIPLYTVVHRGAVPASGQVFVFCHSLFEEKLWAHRVLVNSARMLAAKGHTVIRFDLRGNGDSGGSFAQSNLETALSDARRVIDFVRQETQVEYVNLLGVRFGATLAAVLAEQSSDIDKLILWAPVVHGERYLQEALRTTLAVQMAIYGEVRHDRAQLVEMMRNGESVNIEGYSLAYSMYSQVAAINLADGTKKHAGPCLIVAVTGQAKTVPTDVRSLAGTYTRHQFEVAQDEPFWKEISKSYLNGAPYLSAITVDWLNVV